jgi:hypothetical protein
MDQMAIENCSIVSAKESLPEFGINDRPAVFLPPLILPEIYRTKSGKVVYPVYTQEEKALHWALDRLAGRELPGKAHVEEYFRYMYRRNFRPKTYASNLGAIYIFLTIVRDSGKTRLEEITKHDLEAFIEHEQDRRLMLSTVRTKLHCVNAFFNRLRRIVKSRDGQRPAKAFLDVLCEHESARYAHERPRENPVGFYGLPPGGRCPWVIEKTPQLSGRGHS